MIRRERRPDLVTAFDLVCWWEAEGAEVPAFRLALPADLFSPYLDDYYHQLLRQNCKRYDFGLFNSRRLPDGSRTELSVDDIVGSLTD